MADVPLFCAARLQKVTRQRLDKFNNLRGQRVKPGEFWDVIVITAADDSQKEAYELQIAEKIQRKELPLGVKYHVFADPAGYKIGNGGSTMWSLHHLKEMYHDQLNEYKVLLIHAGGYSQRLPSASAMGKIFTALPLGNTVYQMLDLKLALYVDFPFRMKPGYLVTCADDIELYSISEGETLIFDRPGFTALAHPSSLLVGTTHGVFVFDDSQETGCKELEYRKARCFLHKPAIEKMYSSGAVCTKYSNASGLFQHLDFSGSEVSEFVYTDSTYYFDHGTATQLLVLFKEISPLDCEIDAYGDFLQALGPGATPDYFTNMKNVTKEAAKLVDVRKKLFVLLKGTPLTVILLNNSKFCHIGTTQEYLYHLTRDQKLRAELGFLSEAFSICAAPPPSSYAACVIHSLVAPSCRVAPGSVIEYSWCETGVAINENCIISGCWLTSGLQVPPNTFMHSLCVRINGDLQFVTVVFGSGDDLKRSVSSSLETENLQFFGTSLKRCAELWGISVSSLVFSGDQSDLSLWNLCIFPLCSDLISSATLSLQMLEPLSGKSSGHFVKGVQMVSMQEALSYKDITEMLKFRQHLYQEIDSTKQKKQLAL
ncbi:fucose-1-phosphate guanylyltransferase [Erpetoichthys calabaricus]|nr:fucose-1-phosphate guanylyltransferase [Erpetoichthys calabaricus]